MLIEKIENKEVEGDSTSRKTHEEQNNTLKLQKKKKKKLRQWRIP